MATPPFHLPTELWLQITSHCPDSELISHSLVCKSFHTAMLSEWFSRFPATSRLLSDGHLYIHNDCLPVDGPNSAYYPYHLSFYATSLRPTTRVLGMAVRAGMLTSLTRLVWQFSDPRTRMAPQLSSLLHVLSLVQYIDEVLLDFSLFPLSGPAETDEGFRSGAITSIFQRFNLLATKRCKSLSVILGPFPWVTREEFRAIEKQRQGISRSFTDICSSYAQKAVGAVNSLKSIPFSQFAGSQSLASAIAQSISMSSLTRLRLELCYSGSPLAKYSSSFAKIHLPHLSHLSLVFRQNDSSDEFQPPFVSFDAFLRRHPSITSLHLAGFKDLKLWQDSSRALLPNLEQICFPLHLAADLQIRLLFPQLTMLSLALDSWSEADPAAAWLSSLAQHLETTETGKEPLTIILRINISDHWMEMGTLDWPGREPEYKPMLSTLAPHFSLLRGGNPDQTHKLRLELWMGGSVNRMESFVQQTAECIQQFGGLKELLVNFLDVPISRRELESIGQQIVKAIQQRGVDTKLGVCRSNSDWDADEHEGEKRKDEEDPEVYNGLEVLLRNDPPEKYMSVVGSRSRSWRGWKRF